MAIASTSPSPLTEANLHTATVNVAPTNATFASGATASSFALVTDIQNVSVSQVSGGVRQAWRKTPQRTCLSGRLHSGRLPIDNARNILLNGAVA